jgi:hypothetical protein
VLPSDVADKVKMLTQISGDTERLLHETIRLITITVWTFSRIDV